MNLSVVRNETPQGRTRAILTIFSMRKFLKHTMAYHKLKYNDLNQVNNVIMLSSLITAQKVKFFIKDFFSKCDQIRSLLQIWSHLLKKSLIENFIFWAVYVII